MKAMLFILFFPLVVNASPTNLVEYSKDTILMGARFEITAISDNEDSAKRAVNNAYDEIIRIEKLISSWDKQSETYQVNINAGIKPIKVSKELWELIYRSKKVSQLTAGIFDISFASLDKVWKFDGTMKKLPTDEEIVASVKKINFQNIILDRTKSTVFLKEKGMKIGFGAIGKGYAADKAKEMMLAMGIANGVVNAGGDLICWGKKKDGSDWTIGIADPKRKENILSWLKISDMAVVTSGNYEHFVLIDGKKYCHIINPKTGYPVTGIKSVTIICPDAEPADALATAVFILGKKEGLALINQLEEIECVMVTDDDELITSNNIKLNYYKQPNEN